jgi:hypothetical protein
MHKNTNHNKRPDPERTKALGKLPAEIVRTLTQEEIQAFLFAEVWPDSLAEKLKDYLVSVEQES